MASAVVSYVLGKLADAVIQEVLFLHGVGKKVEATKRELERIRCFVKDADTKRKGDNRVQHWVHEVRRVAFKIEDAIDTFMADVAPGNKSSSTFMKKILKKPAKLLALHKLGNELDEIKSLIDDISKSTSTYGILNLGEGSSQVKRPVRPLIIPEIDDAEVVAFHVDKQIITERLLNEMIMERSVVSIVGQGGLGKTTLALKVYNSFEVKRNFDIQMWLSISQEFELVDLMRKMLKKIQPIEQEELNKLDKEELFTELNKSLQKKKYLIVLDDVWTNDLWTQIIQAFPDLKNGSRILITTRIEHVARAADPTSEPYLLPFLNENDSLKLFIKNGVPGKECPIGLLELAKHFAEKCGGLPLALKILGRFLSMKPPTYDDWNKIFKQMNWKIVGGNCMDIIAMSYENLPPVLKTCFEYFALFPEDYQIDAKSLIRMWVAEGFISEEENQTMEETAEGYLEELVGRSMVQVAKRNYNGSIKYCRIHDLLRDLAIRKAKENDFLTVFSNPHNLTGSDTARRAAFHFPLSDELVEATNPRLRSLFCFDSVRNVSRFRLLRVFNYFGEDEKFNADGFVALTQTRYLGITSFIDNSFDTKKSLQTVDLKKTKMRNKVVEIPGSLWDCKTLRHVNLSSQYDYTFSPSSSADPINLQTLQKLVWGERIPSLPNIREIPCSPSSSADLRNLQTLRLLVVQKSWEGKLPHMPNIREIVFDTGFVDVEYGSKVVADFLIRSAHLVQLTIVSTKFNLFEMKAVPRYHQIQVLIIYGLLSLEKLTFDVSLFPVHLIRLKLDGSGLKEDPMPILGKLNNLKKLTISNVYEGNKMTCLAGDFCRLNNLVMEGMIVNEWKIEMDALPKLKNLNVSRCRFVPDGLHHLTTLHELKWITAPFQFHNSERLRRKEEIRNQTQHVPSVFIY